MKYTTVVVDDKQHCLEMMRRMEEEFKKENEAFFVKVIQEEPSLVLRVHAVTILADLGGEAAIPALTDVLLHDPDPLVRQRIVLGVTSNVTRDERGRHALVHALLDPDRDVRLTIVPPPHTVAHLSGGVIDGYCVGEPWNQQSEALGIGRIALTGPDIWKGMPEKVLGTTESWAANNPQTLKALIKALIEACLWLDEPANRAEAARILSSPRYLNMPAEVMSRTLDLPDFHVFQRNAANFPWRSHADWFLAQMVRWKQAPADTDIKAVADRVYRTDIYRAAARDMGVECPDVDRLPPGGHGEPLLPAGDDKSSTAATAGVVRGSN